MYLPCIDVCLVNECITILYLYIIKNVILLKMINLSFNIDRIVFQLVTYVVFVLFYVMYSFLDSTAIVKMRGSHKNNTTV